MLDLPAGVQAGQPHVAGLLVHREGGIDVSVALIGKSAAMDLHHRLVVERSFFRLCKCADACCARSTGAKIRAATAVNVPCILLPTPFSPACHCFCETRRGYSIARGISALPKFMSVLTGRPSTPAQALDWPRSHAAARERFPHRLRRLPPCTSDASSRPARCSLRSRAQRDHGRARDRSARPGLRAIAAPRWNTLHRLRHRMRR